jgi:lipid II:glycine glycyltransferase (peptidoglycan interpeptide bridge formation enzyme)
MDIRLLTTVPDLRAYEKWLAHHPDASLWQSPAWRAYQEALGRETRLYGALEGSTIRASALVVIDKTTGGLSVWDIPRGPVVAVSGERIADSDDERAVFEQLLSAIVTDAKGSRCLSLYLSPAVSLPATRYPLSASQRHEQPEATRMIDLTLTEDGILAQMHQKGRYNIKVAEKSGVRVEESHDTAAFARLMAETSARDGFRAPSQRQFDAFLQSVPGSVLLLAHAPGVPAPVAGLIAAQWKNCGIYYYGASDYAHRALMAPYALQWRAMRLCKERGCVRYDLLGVAPPEAGPDHPWQGISGFKEKFGGTMVTYPHEQMIVLKPVLSALLAVKRKILR